MSLSSWLLIFFIFFSLLFSLSSCLLWLLQGTFLLLEKSLAERKVKWQIIHKYEVTFFVDLSSMYHWPNSFYHAYFIVLYIMLLYYYFYMWLNAIYCKLKSSQYWSAVVRESCALRWHKGFLESHVLFVSAVWGAVCFRQQIVQLLRFFP